MSIVTFIIPAYNAASSLRECLNSILDQKLNYWKIQVIVVNNNSDDSTVEIAESFPGVKVIHETRRSRAAARQKGLDESAGSMIAFIDADVVLETLWLAKMLSLWEKHPELGGAQSQILPLSESWWHQVRTHRARMKTLGSYTHIGMASSGQIPVINTAASLWKKKALSQGLNLNLHRAEDVDLTMRVLQSGYSLAGQLEACAWVRWTDSFLAWIWRFKEQGKFEKVVYENWNIKLEKIKPELVFNHPLWPSLPLTSQFLEIIVIFLCNLGSSESFHLPTNNIPSKDSHPLVQTFTGNRFRLGKDVRSIFLGEFVALWRITDQVCIWIPINEKNWTNDLSSYLISSRLITKS